MKPRLRKYQEAYRETYLSGYDYWGNPEYDYRTRYRIATRLETEEEMKERNMSRKTFRLLKDTDFLKAGTIVQEACDDGDQAYKVLDFDEAVKFKDFENYDIEDHLLSRKAVENNSEWYEEVVMSWTTKVKRAVKNATKGKK